jgi:hypothetical protein
MSGLDGRIGETYPAMKAASATRDETPDALALEGTALTLKVKNGLGLTYAAMAA